MIPATFAPMILKLIMPKLMDHFAKAFKLPQILDYMELPNDADRLGEQNKEHITMVASEISGLETRLKKLEILNEKPKKVK